MFEILYSLINARMNSNDLILRLVRNYDISLNIYIRVLYIYVI